MDPRLQDLMIDIEGWREDVPDLRHACEELDRLAARIQAVTGKPEADSTLPPGLRILGLYNLVDEAMEEEGPPGSKRVGTDLP